MSIDRGEINLAEIMGAAEAFSVQQLTLYIPHKDRNGKSLKDLNKWIKEAQRLFAVIGGGATTMPPADGSWLKENIDTIKKIKDEDIIWEKTTMIYTYIYPDRFKKNLKCLREFLHRFGRETNQGEVVFEFDGEFFRIHAYDLE
jgi:DNA-directed RNA polymerase alpha subunit